MKVNLTSLHDSIIKAKYQTNIEMRVMDVEDNWSEDRAMNAQQQWNTIVNARHKAADEVIGRTESHRDRNQEI